MLLRYYLEQGLSKAAVARLAGVSRRTVHRWIAAGQLDRDLDEERVRYRPRRPRPSRLDPYKEIIETRLAGYPDLSAVRLFEEIREAGYTGGYDQVRRHVRSRSRSRSGASRPLRGTRGRWTSRSSRRSAFRYFGGVPSELLFDQMKAVIVEDNWGFRIRACRPYRAQTKGKVGAGGQLHPAELLLRTGLRVGRRSERPVLGWLDKVANIRVHGTLKERPVDRFEAERPHPKPLARWPYRPETPLLRALEGAGRSGGGLPGSWRSSLFR